MCIRDRPFAAAVPSPKPVIFFKGILIPKAFIKAFIGPAAACGLAVNINKSSVPLVSAIFLATSFWYFLPFSAVGISKPYLALAPTIVTGAITLGFVQQIIRAFGRVETSLQYLVRSWPIIVELISVQRRLSEFESKLERASLEQEKI